MHKLIDYICEELEELEHKAEKEGKLSMAEVQYGDMLAHFKKNLMKAEEMADDEGYSSRGYSYNMSYEDGGNHGRSYARGGRGRNTRRDNMGRYSQGYSMAVDDMVTELRDLMEQAPNDHTRMEFQKFINRVESM